MSPLTLALVVCSSLVAICGLITLFLAKTKNWQDNGAGITIGSLAYLVIIYITPRNTSAATLLYCTLLGLIIGYMVKLMRNDRTRQ